MGPPLAAQARGKRLLGEEPDASGLGPPTKRFRPTSANGTTDIQTRVSWAVRCRLRGAESLREGRWVNDEAVNTLLTELCRGAATNGTGTVVKAVSSYVLSLKGWRHDRFAPLLQADVILLPINHAQHWSLFVWTTMSKIAVSCNSLQAAGAAVPPPILDTITRFLRMLYEDEELVVDPAPAEVRCMPTTPFPLVLGLPRLILSKCAQQTNDTDCGVYLMANAVGHVLPSSPCAALVAELMLKGDVSSVRSLFSAVITSSWNAAPWEMAKHTSQAAEPFLASHTSADRIKQRSEELLSAGTPLGLGRGFTQAALIRHDATTDVLATAHKIKLLHASYANWLQLDEAYHDDRERRRHDPVVLSQTARATTRQAFDILATAGDPHQNGFDPRAASLVFAMQRLANDFKDMDHGHDDHGVSSPEFHSRRGAATLLVVLHWAAQRLRHKIARRDRIELELRSAEQDLLRRLA